MNITVSQINPRDKMNKISARVVFQDGDGPPYSTANVEVLIEPSDSFAEIRKRAVVAARAFFEKALAADPVEKGDG